MYGYVHLLTIPVAVAGTNMSLDVASDPFRCFDVAKQYTEQIILDLQRKEQKGIAYSVAYWT